MHRSCSIVLVSLLAAWAMVSSTALAGSAAEILPVAAMLDASPPGAPVMNSAFVPGTDAEPAPALAGTLTISRTALSTAPGMATSRIDGRDALAFPGIALQLFTSGDLLVPVARGTMVRETEATSVPSYWRVIPQFGRVWHEPADGDWNRAALPLMLVNDTENHAHQGLATFLYKGDVVSNLRIQFVQQSGPYFVRPHLVAWGTAALSWVAGGLDGLVALRGAAERELADRIPARPWHELTEEMPAGSLDGFGGPLRPEWTVELALLRDGVLYYQESQTAYGPYPYPLEMRFGVRSVMKSVATPLALLHLAEIYGPWVLELKIGDYVPGLDPKFKRIRFIDAANMASGFGGTGTLRTHPNDIYDGYLDGHYDDWYSAPSLSEKLAAITTYLKPYPWEPGRVVRYRDQDFFLLGIAVDAFLKSVRGPDADAWRMLQTEVLGPIGIAHAPAVHTREAGDVDGPAWFNAGYYPSLDDLAKIARLYENAGAYAGHQLLHRELTLDLLAGRGALVKHGDASADTSAPAQDTSDPELYRMGFHFTPYRSERDHRLRYIPSMEGSGENEVLLFPGGVVSLRMAKASELPAGAKAFTDEGPQTIRAVERIAPF